MSALAEMMPVKMQVTDIEEVIAIENDAYPFPWTRGNFLDSLASDYDCWVMRDSDSRLAGYFLLMPAVDDNHIIFYNEDEDHVEVMNMIPEHHLDSLHKNPSKQTRFIKRADD